MRRVVVRTQTQAVAVEEWTFEVPAGTDVATTSFDGAGGWAEAARSGLIKEVGFQIVKTYTYSEYPRQVMQVEEEVIPLANAG